MARPIRLELAGGLYHVTSRGDRGEDIYLDDDDRRIWLALFGEVCARFHWRCHAWCQMTNHYHVVVETADGNLGRGMRHLNGVYTQTMNRLHRRVGHVFQGRYKAILVDRDAYLLAVARYVVLNPVRAGMVDDPGRWPWSSYAATIGRAPAPSWLETEAILSAFDGTRRRAVAAYVDFVRAGIGLPSLWDDLRGQIYLGSDAFVARLQRRAAKRGRSREIPRAQRRPLAKALAQYAAKAADRDAAMAAAYASGDFTQQAIADHFGVHYSTVSRAVNRPRRKT